MYLLICWVSITSFLPGCKFCLVGQSLSIVLQSQLVTGVPSAIVDMVPVNDMTTDLENRIDRLEAILLQTAQLQQQNQQQLNELNNRLHQLTMRVDSFVFEAQRVLSNHGDRLSRVEAAIETTVASYQRLDRNAEADRAEMRAAGQRMDSMIGRLDALMNYLMSQQG